MKDFLSKNKIWFEVITPIGVFITLIFGVYGIFQSRDTFYMQFRPYVYLRNIAFDENSKISLEFSNGGQSIASDVHYIFAKPVYDPNSGFRAEVLNYTTVTGPFYFLPFFTFVDSGVSKDMPSSIDRSYGIPASMGDIDPNTSRVIELQIESESDILWMQNGANTIYLAIKYRDFLGKTQKLYYLLKHDKEDNSFKVIKKTDNKDDLVNLVITGITTKSVF